CVASRPGGPSTTPGRTSHVRGGADVRRGHRDLVGRAGRAHRRVTTEVAFGQIGLPTSGFGPPEERSARGRVAWTRTRRSRIISLASEPVLSLARWIVLVLAEAGSRKPVYSPRG